MKSRIQTESTRSEDTPSNESDPTETTLAASRALLGVVARSLSEALEMVTLPQFRVMVILSAGPLQMSELENRSNYQAPTLSGSVDSMVASGWVEETGHAGSRRGVTVSLTPHGRQLVAHVTERRRQEITEVLDRLDADDRHQVSAAFALFAEAFGEPAVEDTLALGS